LKENRFVVNRRHALSQAGLDNGNCFVAGYNQLCLVLPDEGLPELPEPCRANGRVPYLSSHL
jgi:hypothetical protein